MVIAHKPFEFRKWAHSTSLITFIGTFLQFSLRHFFAEKKIKPGGWYMKGTKSQLSRGAPYNTGFFIFHSWVRDILLPFAFTLPPLLLPQFTFVNV